MKNIFQIIFFLVLLFPVFAHSQSKQNNNEAIATFPFKILIGGTIILKIQIDSSKDSLNFIFDTGNSANTIDSLTATKLKFSSENTNKKFRGVGGSTPAIISKNHLLGFNKDLHFLTDFYIHNYDLLTDYLGIKIDGIIGLVFTKHYVVDINFDSLKFTIYNKKKYIYPRGCEIINLTTNPLFHFPVSLKEKKTNYSKSLIFDTGAGLDLIISRDFVSAEQFYDTNKKIWKTNGEGLAGKISMDLTVTKKLKIGSFYFKNVPTYIIEDSGHLFNHPHCAGLVGNNILKRFNQIINISKSEVCIRPNYYFFERFDYNYLGFNLFSFNNKVYITDIIENSPATKAGLKDFDEVYCINNKCLTDLQSYKAVLQNINRNCTILYKRDGIILGTELKVESILK
ncbi:MAG: aspartyl protease family protein [Sediminibacterium sp.]|nr:aspartyl protease family protein [Sediminibacterium sp.]